MRGIGQDTQRKNAYLEAMLLQQNLLAIHPFHQMPTSLQIAVIHYSSV